MNNRNNKNNPIIKNKDSYSIDVKSNRMAVKWNISQLVYRICWSLVLPFFRLSPRILWKWRSGLLKLFGAKIGKNVHIYPSVRIIMPSNIDIGNDCAIGDRVILYALGKITIGDRSTISQGSHICAGTHDISKLSRPLLKKPIEIRQDVWVCADSFIGPGVTIGRGAIAGARSVVVRDVDAGDTVVGNPARSKTA
jgi:putative colanic acid biosynthesis acetyltransferase WcaF